MRPALLLVLLVAATSASAQQQGDAERDALFKRLDRNGDGYLTPDELRSARALEGNWIAVDRNADGRISLAEFGIVRNFPRTEPASAAGGTQPQKKEPAKASGQP